ncbi:hypothetical protein MJG53_007940 [Ovis ammon polii x Ovis aries]|uniref:Ig-like domain-containing protein n=3 Tax=Ovis TaxID=9935 RepID=A0A836D1Z2_SHEEP|nr:hypothetical protein JEQ12_018566 [Ovis aries]KAI4540286.1 hypothetical protein MG293_009327 [Ovis ammon polii]KAI4582727.1 hypothetical protein MJG53_007940 [Ovis ammon polii x Ovis aries]
MGKTVKTPIGALIMFLWLQLDCVSLGNKVEQSPSTLSVQEGNSSVITCTYTDTASDYFPWYKQEPGKGPQLLIAIRSNMGEKKDQRLTVLLNKTAKHLSLHIATIQPGDSAVYFCAARTQCFPGTCYLYSHLCLGQPPSFDATFKVAFVILFVCKWKLMC